MSEERSGGGGGGGVFSAKDAPLDWGRIRSVNVEALQQSRDEDSAAAVDPLYDMLVQVCV